MFSSGLVHAAPPGIGRRAAPPLREDTCTCFNGPLSRAAPGTYAPHSSLPLEGTSSCCSGCAASRTREDCQGGIGSRSCKWPLRVGMRTSSVFCSPGQRRRPAHQHRHPNLPRTESPLHRSRLRPRLPPQRRPSWCQRLRSVRPFRRPRMERGRRQARRRTDPRRPPRRCLPVRTRSRGPCTETLRATARACRRPGIVDRDGRSESRRECVQYTCE